MFAHSTALLLTNDKNWYARMHTLVMQTGFKEARAFPENPAALAEFHRGPLPFIFVCSNLRPDDLRCAFLAVRSHADLSIRFMPIIMLTEQNDMPTIMKFINLGCDDVITMPRTALQMVDRLKQQVGRPRDYFQTDSYFGPDRRRFGTATTATDSTRGGGRHFFRHFTIQRDLRRGITILNTEVFSPKGRADATG